MVDTNKQDCLGGGVRVMASGTGKAIGHLKYSKYLTANNDYHNNKLCVTLLAYHPCYRDVKVTIGNTAPKKVYKHLDATPGLLMLLKQRIVYRIASISSSWNLQE